LIEHGERIIKDHVQSNGVRDYSPGMFHVSLVANGYSDLAEKLKDVIFKNDHERFSKSWSDVSFDYFKSDIENLCNRMLAKIPFFDKSSIPCTNCNGSGNVHSYFHCKDVPCVQCGGSRHVEESKS
jgi:phenylalanyl-tRNA synthetase beta subunit